MIVLQAYKINKWFGDRQVLQEATLAINSGERIGMVGPNGSGKTTFLKCLTGELNADQGQVSVAAGIRTGYLEQLPDKSPEVTAWEAVMDSFSELVAKRKTLHELEEKMSQGGNGLEHIMKRYAQVTEEYEQANGYACENFARRILIGLGFEKAQFQQPLQTFSGGQRTTLNLARLLALAPELIMLDEPTNHLDVASMEWLEGFLTNYSGTVLVVSHDRTFLNRVATRVVELNQGKLFSYNGNYSSYLKQKAAHDMAARRAYEKQQEYIRKTEAYISRFKAGIKSKQARGRQSQLNRLERLSLPEEIAKSEWSLAMNQESGQDVLEVNEVCQAFNGRQVLNNVTLKLKKGEKLALIGPNGCGKTTLLKMITGELKPDAGEIKRGSRVEIGYFSQEHDDLEESHSVLDEIISNFDLTLEQARTWLGRMLFREDDVFKIIANLSGGERSRLCLLKLILSGANFLLLDEPTNHLDIESREAVEEMLTNYPGTVLFVSHDRSFIDAIADRVAAVEDHRLQLYWGNYSYYHEKVLQMQAEQEKMKETDHKKADKNGNNDYINKQRQKQLRNLKQELEELEQKITASEDKKAELEQILSDPQTYMQEERSRSANDEYRRTEQVLKEYYQHWEIIVQELEAIESK